ncbi:MAG TPA: DUF2207 domain-containing protein, partial [Gaiellaceae bacterium]|nr:DUF2207 domain-containing protein [Gaiellaceae bacterium]
MEVEDDGALAVEEEITFSFSGGFSGAYREIPLREGESVTDVAVEEDGRPYRPGASAEIGSEGAPGTFGVAELEDGVRIVWHYRAAFEARTFTIRYRLAGLAVAYDDVVDVNLQVWGDRWQTGLGELHATMTLPGEGAAPAESVRVFGHPAWVSGRTSRAAGEARLEAFDVPAEQYVELRVVFPRELLASTAGAQVRAGNGLASILAEEREDAEAYERDRERIDSALDNLALTILVLLLLAVVPAAAVVAGVWLVSGRERSTGYDREYEQEPPSDLAPALVPVLLRQGGAAGSQEFTATLFDLIRRGRYEA